MKYFLLCLCAVFLCSCDNPVKQKVVAQVGNYSILPRQRICEEAYKDSSHAPNAPVQSKRDFLNNMINQKLILLDAESHGLPGDKNKRILWKWSRISGSSRS